MIFQFIVVGSGVSSFVEKDKVILLIVYVMGNFENFSLIFFNKMIVQSASLQL